MSDGIHPVPSSRYPPAGPAPGEEQKETEHMKTNGAFKALERVTRIELVSPAWKAGALAIVLHPHCLNSA